MCKGDSIHDSTPPEPQTDGPKQRAPCMKSPTMTTHESENSHSHSHPIHDDTARARTPQRRKYLGSDSCAPFSTLIQVSKTTTTATALTLCTDIAPRAVPRIVGRLFIGITLLMAECLTTSPKCPPLCQILSSLSTFYCLQTLRQISVDLMLSHAKSDDREPSDAPRLP